MMKLMKIKARKFNFFQIILRKLKHYDKLHVSKFKENSIVHYETIRDSMENYTIIKIK